MRDFVRQLDSEYYQEDCFDWNQLFNYGLISLSAFEIQCPLLINIFNILIYGFSNVCSWAHAKY